MALNKNFIFFYMNIILNVYRVMSENVGGGGGDGDDIDAANERDYQLVAALILICRRSLRSVESFVQAVGRTEKGGERSP